MAITENITKSALTVMMRPLEITSMRETRGHQKGTIDHDGEQNTPDPPRSDQSLSRVLLFTTP